MKRMLSGVLLMAALAVFLQPGCGSDGGDQGPANPSGGDQARWGSAVWGQDKWNE